MTKASARSRASLRVAGPVPPSFANEFAEDFELAASWSTMNVRSWTQPPHLQCLIRYQVLGLSPAQLEPRDIAAVE